MAALKSSKFPVTKGVWALTCRDTHRVEVWGQATVIFRVWDQHDLYSEGYNMQGKRKSLSSPLPTVFFVFFFQMSITILWTDLFWFSSNSWENCGYSSLEKQVVCSLGTGHLSFRTTGGLRSLINKKDSRKSLSHDSWLTPPYVGPFPHKFPLMFWLHCSHLLKEVMVWLGNIDVPFWSGSWSKTYSDSWGVEQGGVTHACFPVPPIVYS